MTVRTTNRSPFARWLGLLLAGLALFSHGALAHVPRAVQESYTDLTNGYIFVAAASETFTNDVDGNLIVDGRFAYVWDANNQLTSFTSRTNTPPASWLAGTMTYDFLGRRASKVSSNWTGSAWAKVYEQRYLYDGWNLVAILDGSNTLLYTFRWGADASGTFQGAGGVGGLVSMTVHSGSLAGTYFYAYDGNHNVVALVSAADGSVVARGSPPSAATR